MANNIDVTEGAGKTVATEDVGGFQYQKIKLIDPTVTSSTPIGNAANPLQVSLANTAANATAVKVDGSAVTQPVSAASLPLPTGAATAANQATEISSLGSIKTNTDPLVASGAGGFVRQDSTATIAKETGGNLATLVGGTHLEDDASANADRGYGALFVRQDTPANTSGTDGDYENPKMSAGRVWASVKIDTALPAGSNIIGQVNPQPTTAGGCLVANMTSGDGSTVLSNTAQAIKASAGQLYGWYIYNPNTSAVYIPIYNVAAGSVTVGTTNPQMVLCIPPTSAANILGAVGIEFTNAGFSAAATTTGGGNTAPAIGVEANFFYK